MSDTSAVVPESTTTAAEIVGQMQTLTDIEGDLADTALAVAAVPPASSTSTVAAGQYTPTEGADTLLQNAEAVEQTLEQSIPDPPAAVTVQSEGTKEETAAPEETLPVEPPIDHLPAAGGAAVPVAAAEEPAPAAAEQAEPVLLPDQASDSLPIASSSITEVIPSMPQPSSELQAVPEPAAPIELENSQPAISTAAAAAHAIEKINVDIPQPILPAAVVPPAHDTVQETIIEEETSGIKVDVEEPKVENLVQAVANGEGVKPEEGGLSAIAVGAEAARTSAVAPAGEGDRALPEGLGESSASVRGNPDLIRLWKSGSQDPNVVLGLFSAAVQKTEIQDARVWFGILAADSPTAVQPLLALINLELALSNFPQVEALFATALKGPSGGVTAAADVSIWKAYLHYIRRQNPLSDGPSGEAARGTVGKAYEFALKECGNDRESGEIWQEYLTFLQEQQSKNSWETQQQQDSLRKTYQRAVCIPLNNVEALWKAYDAFESGLNKLTAKKFLSEKSPAYMTARTALRELRSLTDSLPKPILPPHPTFSEEDRRTVGAWKAYLKWEEGNPLVIDDEGSLRERVGYAMRKCLGEMRHFPELWHYTASYYIKEGKQDDAAGVLKAGVEACPKSVLLTFALAELEEDRRDFPSCHQLYSSLIDRLSPEIDELQKKMLQEVEAAKGPEIPPVGEAGDVDMNGEYARLVEEREARGKMVAERRGKEVEEVKVAMSVVWIMYMRFARRAEGIKAARAIFGKSRKSAHLTWHTFEASAMVEYHSNKDSAVAIRIFELGWKLFADDVDYVVRYLQFLLSINDDTNARALFERSAVKIPTSKARPLWDAWARYEYMYGDLSAVHKLEARFAETFPNDSPLKRFAQRFTYNSIDQIALRDLGFGLRARQPPAPSAPITVSAPTQSQPQPPHHTLPANPETSALKRPHPDPPLSPDRRRNDGNNNNSSNNNISNTNKRYRPASPPPPRRFPLPERERDRESRDRGREKYSRDRSPMPPHPSHPPAGSSLPPPPSQFSQQTRNDRPPPLPPVAMGAVGAAAAVPGGLDRSGVGRALAWFVGNLPPARSFDGPIFRPEDIIQLFANISPSGTGLAPAPGGPGGYGPPPIASGPPPMAGQRGPSGGGYADGGRGYGAPPPMRGGRY